MVVVAVLALLAVWTGAVQAHDELRPEPPTITVSATGSMTFAPDQVFVTFGMDTAARSLADAQRQNNAVMTKVMERLRGQSIEKECIQTSAFTVSPQYKPPPKRSSDVRPASPEIIGYLMSNTVTVDVRNLEKVGRVIEDVLAAGTNHFQGLQWALRDEQPARVNALKSAAAKAHEKAVTLSEALGVKLVRVLSVNEGGHVVRPVAHMARSMMAMDVGEGAPPISPGEMKVEATVTLIYEIAPN
ncbi:MAG: SIMPL domain-containing protein [Nitrospira sp.]|nr:SIMPL domain-containing protein [Nitrospira sp.]